MTEAEKIASICEKLDTMYSHRGDGIPTQYVNPDGPEAIAAIRQLVKELDEAREALAEARGEGYDEGRYDAENR